MHEAHAHPEPLLEYVFHIIQNGKHSDRTDGLKFTSKAEAWQEASVSCSEIIREMRDKIEPGLDWQMEVTDHTGKTIYRFTFKAEEL